MFAPIRIAYKFGKTVGSNVAKVLEPFDIKVSNQPALKPFAGHLLGIAKK